jgi:hypothetical protein
VEAQASKADAGWTLCERISLHDPELGAWFRARMITVREVDPQRWRLGNRHDAGLEAVHGLIDASLSTWQLHEEIDRVLHLAQGPHGGGVQPVHASAAAGLIEIEAILAQATRRMLVLHEDLWQEGRRMRAASAAPRNEVDEGGGGRGPG